MNSDLFLQQLEDEDLVTQFCDYTISDLQANLSKLIQINTVYSYCESLIIDDLDCEKEVAEILDCCRDKNRSLLCAELPFELLIKLKKTKDEVAKFNCNRHQIVEMILNLIIENTLLYSSLARFAYE